jgi:hypothetical protein
MSAIRDLTVHLLECLALDVWPRPAAIADFGIATQEHLGALQFAWRRGGRTLEEFDAAMGNGAKLTSLCAVPGQPYRVTFQSGWDEDEEEADAET